MRYVTTIAIVAVALAARFLVRRRRRAGGSGPRERRLHRPDQVGHPIALVAGREIIQRLRGRVLIVSTILILLVVAATIVIPTIGKSHHQTIRVALVGSSPVPIDATSLAVGHALGVTVLSTRESLSSARRGLNAKKVDVVVVGDSRLLLADSLSATDTSTLAQFARSLATQLGIARAMSAAGLSAAQVNTLTHYKALPIGAERHGRPSAPVNATSILGIIVTFIMIQQYSQWMLSGVMEEKGGRVVEVLLATVRPLELITGKVLGIGAVAFAQATVIVGGALAVGAAVGSPILHGVSPWIMMTSLLWLVLGYAFYSWVFAAAGSMVERQDQAQSLAFPLALPLIVGYIYSLVEASAGTTDVLFRLLAYFPPTSLFVVPTLVGRHEIATWQFLLAVAIDLAATVAVARGAAYVYRRAILRTGARVRLRDLRRESRPTART